MKRYLIAALIALCGLGTLGPGQAIAAATLLPPGENCFQANTGTTGMVGTLGTITGGSGGTAGTYGGVALTGGSGTGATANITVAGGAVTAVSILNPGTAYVVGDVLSAASGNIGSVSGFSVPVNSVTINSSLAGGKVYFYTPNTSTFKQTWSDSAQATQNTNPVILDANGCAVIYGTGIYRQVLQDSLGNTVWDQTTTDTSASNSVYWAGVAAGTPNTITVVDPGFNGTNGVQINFVALYTNTGPATLNPSGYAAISIVKDTTAGPVALSGGEIAAGNVVSVLYYATSNTFHLLNLISAAASPSAPLCGAVGLRITNDTTFPNSKLTLTADQVVMQTTSGQYITRNNVSVSINYTTTGAGGLDTGALSSSLWYNNYVIDNGIAPNGLGSLSATAPTMPSGYSYRCRLGAARADTSANFLRFLQVGNRTQNTVTTGIPLPLLATGASGTYPPTVAGNWSAVSTTTCLPPTATNILILPAQSAGTFVLAPNTAYVAGSPWFDINSITGGSAIPVWMMLESSSFYWANNNAGNSLFCGGWIDKVNAN